MKVLKFGGTSMGSAKAMNFIKKIIQSNLDNGEEILLTCSALSGITNTLIELGELADNADKEETINLFNQIKKIHFDIAEDLQIRQEVEKETAQLFSDLHDLIEGIILIKEFSNRSRAYMLSFGERLSTRILTIFLNAKDVNAQQFDSNFIKTKGYDFLKDEVDWDATTSCIKKALLPYMSKRVIPIITGFWGVDSDGITRLLGRGGSDFSAAILAVSLNISTLEIWTDVDGFLSADPRIVNDADIIDEIGFQEASELCFFGAKVLHPKTIRPVIENNGEVWIKNTFSPHNVGTKISKMAKESFKPVISISSKEVEMITLDLFATTKVKSIVLDEVFQLSYQNEIHIDMLALSEAQVSFCIEYNQSKIQYFLKKLNKICPFYHKTNRSIICIVSPKEVKGQIGVAGKIFGSISESNVSVDMYSQNASEIAQLIVVKTKDTKRVIQKIHKNLVVGEQTI